MKGTRIFFLALTGFLMGSLSVLGETGCVVHVPCRQCTHDEKQSTPACGDTGFIEILLCKSYHRHLQDDDDSVDETGNEFVDLSESIADTDMDVSDDNAKIDLRPTSCQPNGANNRVIEEGKSVGYFEGGGVDIEVEQLIRFELLMVGVAAYSVYYVRKRKRLAYQRLTTVVNA